MVWRVGRSQGLVMEQGGRGAAAAPRRENLGHHIQCTALYRTHNGSVPSPSSDFAAAVVVLGKIRRGAGGNPASCG